MRILWVSNNINTPSSYGSQTKQILHSLQRLGHEVALLAYPGIQHGSPVELENILVLPMGAVPYSQDKVAARAAQFNADIVVSFIDAWVLKPEMYPGVRHICYYPVDTDALRPGDKNALTTAWDSICLSVDGQEKAKSAGITSGFLPLGVDTEVFRPLHRENARQRLGLPQEPTIFGIVAANTDDWPTRKHWHETIAGFAQYLAYDPDALLYCHTEPHGRVNIIKLIEGLGIQKNVFITHPEQIADGFSADEMAHLYNCFDALVMLSKGEGCGIPLLEAQACGIPVITGQWTGMGENAFGGVIVPSVAANLEPAPGMPCEGVYRYAATPECVRDALYAFSQMTEETRAEAGHNAMLAVRKYRSIDAIEALWKDKLNEWQTRIAAERAPKRNRSPVDLTSDFRDQVHRAQVTEAQVVLVCPSYGESCGIAEYTGSQVWELFRAGIRAHVATTVQEADAIARSTPSVKSVIVHHEYSLFGKGNPHLSQGEPLETALRNLKYLMTDRPDLKVGFVMHTVAPYAEYAPINHTIAQSGVPVFATSLTAAQYLSAETGVPVRHCPLGAWSLPGIETAQDRVEGAVFQIGNFGMLGPQRDIPAQIELCKRTKSVFVGSFATSDATATQALNNSLRSEGVASRVWHDWANDQTIQERLRSCDVLFMPRSSQVYYQSASVMTALNARRPIIANADNGYSDLTDVLCIAQTNDEAEKWVERLRDPKEYARAVDRIDRYQKERGIVSVYREAGLLP